MPNTTSGNTNNAQQVIVNVTANTSGVVQGAQQALLPSQSLLQGTLRNARNKITSITNSKSDALNDILQR